MQYLVSEVCQCDLHVKYAFRPIPGANETGLGRDQYTVHCHNYISASSGTYRLAKSPMQKDDRAEMAAVAVTRSRLISATHSRYSSLSRQLGSPPHPQVPPESETMEALTAMMYAMAKKAARPARISVKK
jgi:hypothetical protein